MTCWGDRIMDKTHRSRVRWFLASFALWCMIACLTILLFFVMVLVTAATFPFDKMRRCQHGLCIWWSDAVIAINPYWKVVIRQLEGLHCDRPYIIVSNHQSISDIVLLLQTRMHFKWVAKRSLFRVPFLGWCMSLCRHVRLRHANASSIIRAYQESSDWIAKGVSVMFFPEGTRNPQGRMLPFHNGAFRLAMKKKVSILPIAIHGTASFLPKGTWRFNPGCTVGLTVLPPRDPDSFQGLDANDLKQEVWESIHRALLET